MSKEYNDRDIKPLREQYREVPDLRADFVSQLATIVAPLQGA